MTQEAAGLHPVAALTFSDSRWATRLEHGTVPSLMVV